MNIYKVMPAEQRVLVLPEKQDETRTNSGIIIPASVDTSKPETGRVVAVGKGSKDIPMEYKVGQTVFYSQYSGLELKFNLGNVGEHTFKAMNQMDIIGVLEEVEK